MVFSQPHSALNRRVWLLGLAVFISFLGVWATLRFPLFVWALPAAGLAAGFLFAPRFRLFLFLGVYVLNSALVFQAAGRFNFWGLSIHPIDWAAFLLTAAVFLRQALSGRRTWSGTGFELPIVLFLAGSAASLFVASNLRAGLVGWGHNLLYLAAFYALVADWKNLTLEGVWRPYRLWVIFAVFWSLWDFFASGGKRSMGISGWALPHLVLPVICFLLAGQAISEKKRNWLYLGALVLALAASQTRGVWIGLGVAAAAFLFSGHFLRKGNSTPVGVRVVSRFLKLAVVLVLLFVLLAPFMGEVQERARQAVEQTGTVYLRLFLWGLGVQLFAEHPLFGIGLGQFAGELERFPEMKSLAVFQAVQGLSVHNFFLSFLAETGLVGTVPLAAFFVLIVWRAWKALRQARSAEELRFGWGLFLCFCFLAFASLYSSTWGYLFMYFLALLVTFERKLREPLRT